MTDDRTYRLEAQMAIRGMLKGSMETIDQEYSEFLDNIVEALRDWLSYAGVDPVKETETVREHAVRELVEMAFEVYHGDVTCGMVIAVSPSFGSIIETNAFGTDGPTQWENVRNAAKRAMVEDIMTLLLEQPSDSEDQKP